MAKRTTVTPAKPKDTTTTPLRYFIVNPAGTVHEVTDDHARMRLQQVGWRQATKEEVQEYLNRNGNQRFDNPIAPPWTPEPTPIELEGLDFTVMNDL